MESMTKRLSLLPVIFVLALPFVHPFGAVRQQNSSALLPDVPRDDTRVLLLFETACQNCHSQRTQWPLYSYLPLVSWALEKDVAEARQHMDLSRWDQYSSEQKRDLLARMGTEVRNRRMPPPRYVLLHPEARLSESEIQLIYEWTKAQRRAMRRRVD
jgi:cytochrome c